MFKNYRNILLIYLKIFFTLSLLLLAFYNVQIDFTALINILNNKYFYLVFLIIIFSLIIQNILHGLRFKIAAKKYQINVNFSDSLLVIHISGFVGLTPFGILGYEIYRVNFLKKITSYKKSLSIIFLDRLFGLLAMFLVSILSYLLIIKKEFSLMNLGMSQPINSFIFFLIFLLLLFIIIPKDIYFFKISKKIRLFFDDIFSFLKSDKIFDTRLSLVSIMMCIVVPIALALSSSLLNHECPPLVFFAIVSIAILITIVPITFGGFGLRESAFIYLADLFGYSQEEFFIISIIFSLSIIIAYSPGFFLLLIKKIK